MGASVQPLLKVNGCGFVPESLKCSERTRLCSAIPFYGPQREARHANNRYCVNLRARWLDSSTPHS
eukprot:626404-Rhodomonas_salina.1